MARIIKQHYSEREAARLLRKAQTNLWWLATEILGFDLLTEDFHKPMMDDMDANRLLRTQGKPLPFDHEMWARDYFKTTVRKAMVIQDYLCNPFDTITWWHAVEEMASEVALACGKMLQKNKKLRKLRPDMMPSPTLKKFASAKGFRLPGNELRRDLDAPSFRAWGAGSEATGGHSKRGYLDDIIGHNTIEDNLMPKIRSWYGKTVTNVISTGKPGQKAVFPIFGTGTHWDPADIYCDWKKSSRWNVRIRAAYETDGSPDYNGQPVLYSRAQIENKRSRMTEFEFACQMMNDTSLASEKLWVHGSERIVTKKECQGPGMIVVLSDPAPYNVGSFDLKGEADRKDGSKDEWAICVVKIMVVGGKQVIVLLAGDASRTWRKDDGFRRNCQYAMRYRTPYIVNEATGNAIALYWEDQQKIAREMLCPLYTGQNGKGLQLQWTYRGKNNYFENLASKAMRGEFWVLDECAESDFWQGAVEQAEGWRCMANGRNALRFDDRINAVSFATDPALQQFAPTPDFNDEDDLEYRIAQEEDPIGRFRYMEDW